MIDETLEAYRKDCLRTDEHVEGGMHLSKTQALAAIYEIGLEVINGQPGEIIPYSEKQDNFATGYVHAQASQRKAWAKACGVAEK